jgi:hypothetical protein
VKHAIAAQRLTNQNLVKARRGGPAELVQWLGAVQAQEYPFAKWALGLRMRAGTTEVKIERALNQGAVLRTHVLRPTWHFVARADIRWMLALTAPRIQRTMASYNRRLELDSSTLTRALHIIERALGEGGHLTRAELAGKLEEEGIVARLQRLAHVVMHAELEGLICSGPRRGKHFTYALIAERAPAVRSLQPDEALAELTLRYFRSHGPATIRDFGWWSGLPGAEIRRGLDMNRARSIEVDGRVYWTLGRSPRQVDLSTGIDTPAIHLLPIYDEYLVAYRDREAVPHGPTTITNASRAEVMFLHALVIEGQIVGTWKPVQDGKGPRIQVTPMRRLSATEREGIHEAAARYESFLGLPDGSPLQVSIS